MPSEQGADSWLAPFSGRQHDHRVNEIIEMLLPAVEEQITSAETAYVKDTYERLSADAEVGPEEAKQMIAVCLADEMEAMMTQEREFDPKRYKTLLELLPKMPE